jgi:ArsR family transcriptional regulator, arsenate/arsenite/antimonite-responsive transcriptional repressor / arsenate reductase (thioredoxin)
MVIPQLRVLFLCTENSARSQMAEAILRQMTHGAFDVASAGSAPGPEIHPMAVNALAKLGISVIGQRPKPLQRFLDEEFDYVITVCDRSAERCPVFPGDPERIHWSFDDPAAVTGSDEERQRAFNTTASQMVSRIRIWLSLPSVGGRVGQHG